MRLSDLNIDDYQVVITPTELKKELPLPESARELIAKSRQTVKDILDGKDDRLFAVVGPCSIHDIDLALTYGRRLKALADQVNETIFIIMRVYFEKPRTTVGWKGLINDPSLNGSYRDRITKSTQLLIELSEWVFRWPPKRLTRSPHSICKIRSLGPLLVPEPRITRRTVTARACLRLLASKRYRRITRGRSQCNEIVVSGHHSWYQPQGQAAITRSKGNQYGHVVLRGGR